MTEVWAYVEIPMCSTKNIVKFEFDLYVQELSNFIVMYCLFFSLCGYRIFRIGVDIKI